MRYARQEVLELIGKEGQAELAKKIALIVGAGATGSVAAELLVRAGVSVKIIDKDIVDVTNLQRQALYTEEDVNRPKAEALKKHLERINSTVKVEAMTTQLDTQTIKDLEADILLDCTDHQDTRFLINEYCMKNSISWIHSAALKEKGEVLTVIPGKTACFRCVMGDAAQGERCEEAGILNSASHVVAALQANEAIKVLLGKKYDDDLLRVDVWNNTIEHIKTRKYGSCKVCRGEYALLDEKKEDVKYLVTMCKRKAAMAAKPIRHMSLDFDKLKSKYEVVLDTPILLVLRADDEVIVYKHGEILFKTMTDEDKVRKAADKIYEVAACT
ncbi:MAG: ThiF family adenylyltransferase [Candidatus Nanoarchaeia archaeon]